MNNRGLSLLEILIVVFAIGLLAALLLPPICGPRHQLHCANNLAQLYKLGTVHASTHKGEWPDVQGEELWLSFTRSKPPLIELEHASILSCPLMEECGPGETHYRGPRLPWKKVAIGEPLGGDKPGNHGEDYGGNVLMKDGRVEEIALKHPLWKQCQDLLRP